MRKATNGARRSRHEFLPVRNLTPDINDDNKRTADGRHDYRVLHDTMLINSSGMVTDPEMKTMSMPPSAGVIGNRISNDFLALSVKNGDDVVSSDSDRVVIPSPAQLNRMILAMKKFHGKRIN